VSAGRAEVVHLDRRVERDLHLSRSTLGTREIGFRTGRRAHARSSLGGVRRGYSSAQPRSIIPARHRRALCANVAALCAAHANGVHSSSGVARARAAQDGRRRCERGISRVQVDVRRLTSLITIRAFCEAICGIRIRFGRMPAANVLLAPRGREVCILSPRGRTHPVRGKG
jgi:hypothetical protein